jgi:thiamine-phosphate pyrophosphorylase
VTEPTHSAVLRLLDANLNRAREAFRVLEDYARFVLDDGSLSARLKELRHGLAAASRTVAAEAILFRDTLGDIGRENKTPAELVRADLADVVTAAGKRLGEALRAIEEYLKTISPKQAAEVEAIRYRCYAVEQQIVLSFRKPGCFEAVELYVLITEAVCKRPWLEAAEQAMQGGADCLQLREKELESGELLARARQLVQLCRRYGALCIINNRADIALLSNADGVHLGQGDLPIDEARKIVGRDAIIGISTHNFEQAKQAQSAGADYIGVGPCFVSGTKPRSFVAGIDWLHDVVEQVRIPAIAIAGITPSNVDEVLRTGVRRIAVTAAVVGSDDPLTAAKLLKSRLRNPQTAPVVAT